NVVLAAIFENSLAWSSHPDHRLASRFVLAQGEGGSTVTLRSTGSAAPAGVGLASEALAPIMSARARVTRRIRTARGGEASELSGTSADSSDCIRRHAGRTGDPHSARERTRPIPWPVKSAPTPSPSPAAPVEATREGVVAH